MADWTDLRGAARLAALLAGRDAQAVIAEAAREYVRAYHLCDSGLTGLPLYEALEAFDDAQQALVAAVEAEGAS